MTMPAGKYWIGDLCYVMHEVWDEFCDITIEGNNCKDGEFTLKDGRRFATYGTFYGDGSYSDNHRNSYGVDAGLIGCILLKDIDQTAASNHISSGHIHEFKNDFTTSEHNGTIEFGTVVIETNYDDDYVSDNDYDDDQ